MWRGYVDQQDVLEHLMNLYLEWDKTVQANAIQQQLNGMLAKAGNKAASPFEVNEPKPTKTEKTKRKRKS